MEREHDDEDRAGGREDDRVDPEVEPCATDERDFRPRRQDPLAQGRVGGVLQVGDRREAADYRVDRHFDDHRDDNHEERRARRSSSTR